MNPLCPAQPHTELLHTTSPLCSPTLPGAMAPRWLWARGTITTGVAEGDEPSQGLTSPFPDQSAVRVQAAIPRDCHSVTRSRCASLSRSCNVGGCCPTRGLDPPLNTEEVVGSGIPGCRRRRDPPGCPRARCGTEEPGSARPLGWTRLLSTQGGLKRKQNHQGIGNTLYKWGTHT